MTEALARPDPHFEQNPSLELAVAPDGLSPHTAQRLCRAASHGQLGKAWRHFRAPPPMNVGSEEWHQVAQKLFPHESTPDPPSQRGLKRGFPVTKNLARLFNDSENTGQIFIHPHPPTPENTLLGVGGV